jgi:NAD(P)-dependent dehydrogenase (short-subunit alcohol dehydrogenase family)
MKNVLITGISRGIGKATAQKFLNEGYYVIGTSVSNDVDFTHENLKVIQLDLTDSDSIRKCVDEIEVLGLKIDILDNNAGMLFDDGETHLSIEKLRETLEINLIGTADFTERLVPFMNTKGHIIFISSSAGSISETDYTTHSHHPNQYPAYKISKAALNMYMRTLAMRLEKEVAGIKVSSVHPGWVKTEMGGDDAPMTPEGAALHIFTTATNESIETGQFWYKGERYRW